MKKFVFLFLIFLWIISFANAIIGSSQSYSVSTFGNGIVSGDASSGNYNSVLLSENRGTTSGAMGNNINVNIGFFVNSPYTRTVGITSYSITPLSAVVGSTIAFSINAVNANQVWVEITPPNSQDYTLNLINGQSVNHLPIPSIVGTYQVVFYAQSSTGAIASVVSSFVLTAQSSNGGPTVSGGPGGSSSGATVKCNYIWECTPWSVCSNNIQNRICTNSGSCIGVQGKPVEQVSCSESLFDVLINLESLQVSSNYISFDVSLTEVLNSDELDVHIKYAIIDSENNEIFSQIETRAVGEELAYTKIIDGLNLVEGNYKLRVDVLYGNLQRAFAEQSFDYSSGGAGITGFAGEGTGIGFKLNNLVIGILAAILLALIILYILISQKKKVFVANVSNSVLGLDGLEVYTDSGIKLGKVYDVMIEENKIYGLMIVVDKDAGIKYPKILIKYNYVQNVKDAVIVSSVVLASENHSNG